MSSDLTPSEDFLVSIKAFFSEKNGEVARQIRMDTALMSEGCLDSLDIAEYLAFIATRFGMQIELGDISMADLQTPRKLYSALADRSE